MACGREWKSNPGHVTCKCGSLYVEWVNYDSWHKKKRKKRR